LLDAIPGGVAVSVGNRIVIWRNGLPTGASHTLESPALALAYHGGVVFAGQGNRVHAFRLPGLDPAGSLVLQSGAVRGIYPIPIASSDGVHDGTGLPGQQQDAMG